MHILADLGARSDRGPRIDHCAFVYIRADVDVRRHEHRILANEGAPANHGRRNDAISAATEVFAAEMLKFTRYLVEVLRSCAVDGHIVSKPERKQHRFLQPLMN